MPPSHPEYSRRQYPDVQWTWVRDKETGHRYAAPFAVDRLPEHLEALNEPALDRNGHPRPAKLKQPIAPRARKSSPSPEPDPAAGGANEGDQAANGQPSTAQANKEAMK